MYKRVLAAVNQHLNSEVAARYAAQLARAVGAKLSIAFVAEKGLSPSALKAAEAAVARLFQAAVAMGVEAEAVAETGEPVREIGKIVKAGKVDIAFVSARREDVQRRFYAGTAARRLLLGLPCSAALVRVAHAGRIQPGKILLPIGSRVNRVEERAYFTANLAKAFDASVFVFHVHKPVSKFFHGEVHLSPVEWERRLPGDVKHFMEHLRRHGVDPSGSSAAGRAGRAITLEAFAKRHDLIVMGASRRSLISSILRGNPVEEVLRETPCDLIILRPGRENP